MSYYKLGVNPKSNKWKGYMNPGSFLTDGEGNEFSGVRLSANPAEFNDIVYFNILEEGMKPPVISIGSRLVAFDADTFDIDGLKCCGINLIPLINIDNNYNYALMNILSFIDCVNWECSILERWPSDYIPKAWESKQGRFFIEPVLHKNKIPENSGVFRLYEWGGAFNIVISERFKKRLLSNDFDYSFLDIKLLTLT